MGDQRMLVAVLQFGTSLGLRVVMEGVETQKQLDLVRRLGFAAAQGFVLAAPMPPEGIPAWLARNGVGRSRCHACGWRRRPEGRTSDDPATPCVRDAILTTRRIRS